MIMRDSYSNIKKHDIIILVIEMKLFKKQSKYSFLQIKELLLKSINEYNLEAELSIWFKDKPDEYMITIYDDFCAFQRCGNKMLSNTFKTLDELYKSQQMDNIILQRDWNKIIKFESYDFEIFGLWKHSKNNNITDRKKQHSLEKYIHKNKVCSDDIYRNYKAFLEILYNNGYKVTDILWFDYCKIDEQDKSLGQGGFIDKENKDYMWAETQI